MERIYRTIKSVLDSSSLEDTNSPTNFSLIDSFRYNSLENKDASTNFSLIDSIKNNTGTRIVAFPGPYWFFPEFFPELCAVCF